MSPIRAYRLYARWRYLTPKFIYPTAVRPTRTPVGPRGPERGRKLHFEPPKMNFFPIKLTFFGVGFGMFWAPPVSLFGDLSSVFPLFQGRWVGGSLWAGRAILWAPFSVR